MGSYNHFFSFVGRTSINTVNYCQDWKTAVHIFFSLNHVNLLVVPAFLRLEIMKPVEFTLYLFFFNQILE